MCIRLFYPGRHVPAGAGTNSRDRWATAAAFSRLSTFSFARMCDTWSPAVFGVMKSRSPIWRLVRPSATRSRTSASRRVSPNASSRAAGLPRAPERRTRARRAPGGQRLDLAAEEARSEPIRGLMRRAAAPVTRAPLAAVPRAASRRAGSGRGRRDRDARARPTPRRRRPTRRRPPRAGAPRRARRGPAAAGQPPSAGGRAAER